MDGVQVWTMRMNPVDGEGSFKYCKDNNVIGFGWGAQLNEEPKDFEECKKLYKEAGADKAINNVLNAVDKMIKNIENINKDDITNLVWTIDDKGTYYLCIVDGIYEYIRDGIENGTGVCNTVGCSYHEIGNVPILLKGFNPPKKSRYSNDIERSIKLPGTIHEVGDKLAIEFSKNLYISITS